MAMICPNCLSSGEPNYVKGRPGSGPVFGVIIFGVLGLIVPFGMFWMWPMAGLCFLGAIARAITHAAKSGVPHCARCNAANVVPLDTPGGQQLLARAQGGYPQHSQAS